MPAPTDTGADARGVHIATYRSMGGPRRLLAAFQMSEEMRLVAAAGLRARNPDWTDEQVERAVAALLLTEVR